MIPYDEKNPIHQRVGYFVVRGEPEFWKVKAGPLSGPCEIKMKDCKIVYGLGKFELCVDNRIIHVVDFYDVYKENAWQKCISHVDTLLPFECKTEEFWEFVRGTNYPKGFYGRFAK